MSYKGFLNDTCSWTRKSAGTQDSQFRSTPSDTTVEEGESCRFEPMSQRELDEIGLAGGKGISYEKFFFDGVVDLQQGDKITVDGQRDTIERTVVLTGDAGGEGHHTEATIEKFERL